MVWLIVSNMYRRPVGRVAGLKIASVTYLLLPLKLMTMSSRVVIPSRWASQKMRSTSCAPLQRIPSFIVCKAVVILLTMSPPSVSRIPISLYFWVSINLNFKCGKPRSKSSFLTQTFKQNFLVILQRFVGSVKCMSLISQNAYCYFKLSTILRGTLSLA